MTFSLGSLFKRKTPLEKLRIRIEELYVLSSDIIKDVYSQEAPMSDKINEARMKMSMVENNGLHHLYSDLLKTNDLDNLLKQLDEITKKKYDVLVEKLGEYANSINRKH